MRLGLGRLLTSLLVFGLCGAGFAAEKAVTKSMATPTAQKSQKADTKQTKSTKPLKFRGDVSAIDSNNGSVSVKGQAGEKRFVTENTAKDAVERLAVGDAVRVTYSEKDGKLVASSVRRMKPTRAKAASQKTMTNESTQPQKETKTTNKSK